MIDLFCHIAKLLANNGLNPAEYRFTVTPLSTEAELKFMKSMHPNPAAEEIRAGFISGMPFRVEKAK